MSEDKILNQTIFNIWKKYGKESIMRLGEKPAVIDAIPTGSIFLDEAIGVGGFPRGRIIEIYGPESSGKTTLALHGIAEAQKIGETAAFIDAENGLDIKYASNIGVNINDLLCSQPECGEEALDITESLIRSNRIGIIVIDSVAALTPRAEIEGQMGDSHMGLQARLMSQALRKLSSIIAKTNTIVIFINQIRLKIGIVFGNPEVTTGGNALKFYASIRLDIRRKEKIIDSNKNVIGNNVLIKVVKNKVAPPFKEVHTCIMFGVGIHKIGELLQYHVEHETIEKMGSWFQHNGQKIQGMQNMYNYIEEHIDEFEIK